MICTTSQKYPLKHGRCGKCMACRIDRRQEWTARMLFESYMHPYTSFATLTYAPEHLPKDNSVDVREAQLFLKRLRNRLAREDGRSFRYFLCGEYGDSEKFTGRAHYHAILYGVSVLDHEHLVKAWDQGIVTLSEANRDRMAYTAGYVQKKLIKKDVTHYPDGRRNEFAVMSRNPGLGRTFIEKMAKGLISSADNEDVSLAGLVRMDGRKYPLDRYGRNLLITELVDMGVPWRNAERLILGPERKGHTEDGSTAHSRHQIKMERQNKFLRQRASREKVKRAERI